ncbi:MAG: transposase domain protein [Edaphobacter sp.]|nr:transposase domain protein [Edaphobacter sp.]
MKEGRGKFGYFNNYLIDTDHAVIVDVEATPARLAQEIIATKVMLKRVEETHHIRPERLAADKAYGTGPFLGWLSKRKIIPHIPVLDNRELCATRWTCASIASTASASCEVRGDSRISNAARDMGTHSSGECQQVAIRSNALPRTGSDKFLLSCCQVTSEFHRSRR